jgi:choline dehydrogenase-like flavoprotein
MPGTEEHYDVVVIGSGFGGSMSALALARAFKARGRGERVLMLERGTWCPSSAVCGHLTADSGMVFAL